VTTTNDATAAIERRIGIPKSRGVTVARRLTEHGLLPAGAPGKAPELDRADFVTLLIGLASDAPLSRVADAVATYRDLTPAGTPIDVLPASLQFSAGNFLDVLTDAPENSSHMQIEFVSTWPGVTIHYADGTVRRFVKPGSDASRWQHSGYLKSTTINGSAYRDCVLDLFGKE
jgi:hypothetical protein